MSPKLVDATRPRLSMHPKRTVALGGIGLAAMVAATGGKVCMETPRSKENSPAK